MYTTGTAVIKFDSCVKADTLLGASETTTGVARGLLSSSGDCNWEVRIWVFVGAFANCLASVPSCVSVIFSEDEFDLGSGDDSLSVGF